VTNASEDIRVVELRFLLAVAGGGLLIRTKTGEQATEFTLDADTFEDMIEDLLLTGLIDHPALRRIVAYARPDPTFHPTDLPVGADKPAREHLRQYMRGREHPVRITFRGRQRIEFLRAELQRDRILDPLGVLLDLRYRDPELQRALARQSPPVGAIVLDLDGFKRINDDYGHPAGDAVLVAYLTAVRDEVAHHGVAIRAGGDEVNVITTGLDREAVGALAERIRQRVAALEVEHERRVLPQVTTSIGVAVTPPAPRTRGLVDAADRAQIAAKKGGKDRVHDGSAE
jgi:diguanylate cyclase (GGDEF)-like protein